MIWRAALCVAFLVFGGAPTSTAQDDFPPVPDDVVKRYVAKRTAGPIKIDGKLDEDDWEAANQSPRFADLISGGETLHDTRAAVLWDDDYLYIAFWIEDPFVRAKFTERDSPIYQDNDVEVFIGGADAYYEFEINAHGTLYEGFFIWQEAFERTGYSKMPEFDQSRADVRWQEFNGVGLRNHPRGKRFAYLGWDFPKAKTAVHIDGTLNDDSDRDQGWTVELAFPWEGMHALAMGDDRALPPNDGDVWRMDFSRFNQFKESNPKADSGGWAWSYHGVWDSHIPECFPYIAFSNQTVNESDDEAAPGQAAPDETAPEETSSNETLSIDRVARGGQA